MNNTDSKIKILTFNLQEGSLIAFVSFDRGKKHKNIIWSCYSIFKFNEKKKFFVWDSTKKKNTGRKQERSSYCELLNERGFIYIPHKKRGEYKRWEKLESSHFELIFFLCSSIFLSPIWIKSHIYIIYLTHSCRKSVITHVISNQNTRTDEALKQKCNKL